MDLCFFLLKKVKIKKTHLSTLWEIYLLNTSTI